ncbi:MAG: hypothetical protein WBA74_23725, partial [Cyclobacteriaceae bacterium]
MKWQKILVFIAIVLISPVIAAVYGIIHDQITYTLSSEYYTNFKFIQFGLSPTHTTWHPDSPRAVVALVGIM